MTATSVSAFDLHRRGGECVEPSKAGLALNSSGIWAMPGEREFFK